MLAVASIHILTFCVCVCLLLGALEEISEGLLLPPRFALVCAGGRSQGF